MPSPPGKKTPSPRAKSPSILAKAQAAEKAQRDTRYFVASIGVTIFALIPGQLGLTGINYAAAEGLLGCVVLLCALFWSGLSNRLPKLTSAISSFVSSKAWFALIIVFGIAIWSFDLSARAGFDPVAFVYSQGRNRIPAIALATIQVKLHLRFVDQNLVSEDDLQLAGVYNWTVLRNDTFQRLPGSVSFAPTAWAILVEYNVPTLARTITVTTANGSDFPFKVLVNDPRYLIIATLGALPSGGINIETRP